MATDSTDDLQFSTPEPIAADVSKQAATPKCVGCGKPITSTYYAFRDKTVCPQCVQKINEQAPGVAAFRFIKAGVFGLGGGILGALIWYAVRRIAHAEIGLVAIVVGFLVGKAVRKGSDGRGGVGFQVMAVVLTYCCICANYVPDLIQDGFLFSNGSTPQENLRALEFCLRIPFLGGASNAIGLLIIGFALWEAWKFNRPRRLAISGPYQLGGPRSANLQTGVVA